MKKNLFTAISLSSITLFSNNPALSAIDCGSVNLSASTATECVNDAIKDKIDEVYAMANDKGHRGDMAKCTTYTSASGATYHKSYFPDDESDFKAVFKDATVSGTCIYNVKYNAYDCWVTPKTNVCYIAGGGSNGIVEKTDIVFGVDKASGEIRTFHPKK